jgi:hypothetical protein
LIRFELAIPKKHLKRTRIGALFRRAEKNSLIKPKEILISALWVSLHPPLPKLLNLNLPPLMTDDNI